MKFKYLLWFGAIALVIGLAIAWMMYNKPHPDAGKGKADVTISATELGKEFKQDEQAANLKYLGKLVEVSGVVAEVSVGDSLTMSVVLKEEGSEVGVSCLLKERPASEPSVNAKISIRGFCSGYDDLFEQVQLTNAVPTK
jgi:hypothetical protein